MSRKNFLIASSTAILFSVLSSASVFAQSIAAALTIDPTVVMTNDRLILTVTGTYTCGPFSPSASENYASLNLTLRQVSGRKVVFSSYYFSSSSVTSPLLCDGNTKPFQAPLMVNDYPFHGGKARVNGDILAETCDPSYVCQDVRASTDAQVKIQGGGN